MKRDLGELGSVLLSVIIGVSTFCPGAARAASVELVPVWVRLGDDTGAVDQDKDTASVESADFSPDGTLIVSGSKGQQMGTGGPSDKGTQVKLWRVSDGMQLWSHPRTHEIEVVAFSKDGTMVAFAGEEGIIEILRIKSPAGALLQAPQVVTRLDPPGETASIDGMRFSPSGKYLATGTEGQRLHLWRTADWSHASATSHGGSGTQAINSVDWSADDGFVTTAGTNTQVKYWRVNADASLTLLRTHTEFKGSVKVTRWKPDNSVYAAGGRNHSGVLVWDRASGRLVATIAGKSALDGETLWETIEAIMYSPDGKYLVTGGNTYAGDNFFGKLRVYDTTTYKEVFAVKTPWQEHFAFNADGSRMVSTHEDGTLRLWQVRATETVPADAGPQSDAARDTTASRDGAVMADTSGDRSVEVSTNGPGLDAGAQVADTSRAPDPMANPPSGPATGRAPQTRDAASGETGPAPAPSIRRSARSGSCSITRAAPAQEAVVPWLVPFGAAIARLAARRSARAGAEHTPK